MAQTGEATVIERVLEPLTLRMAKRRALSHSVAQREQMLGFVDAAKRRLDGARQLREPRHAVAALELHRQAMLPLVAGLLAAHAASETNSNETDGDVLETAHAGSTLDDLIEKKKVRLPPGLEKARKILISPEALAADQLSLKEATATRNDAEILTDCLLAQLEIRTPGQIQRTSIIRMAVLVAALLVAVVALVVAMRPKPNVALGKPVKTSSRDEGTPDPAGAVDGVKTGAFGFQTKRQRGAWVSIDLERLFSIDEVVVYNRGDGKHRDALPLYIDLAPDQKHFKEVASTRDEFSQEKPWRASLGGRQARMVRVRVAEPAYLALSEIEVFGAEVTR